MTTNLQTGRKGEDLATEYLRQKLYNILERNWRHSHCEVDIIAKDKEQLVFVEVKTRTSSKFGLPEESVDTEKQHMLIQAAQAYQQRSETDLQLRFDIVSVDLSENRPVIEHFEDAFYPVS